MIGIISKERRTKSPEVLKGESGMKGRKYTAPSSPPTPELHRHLAWVAALGQLWFSSVFSRLEVTHTIVSIAPVFSPFSLFSYNFIFCNWKTQGMNKQEEKELAANNFSVSEMQDKGLHFSISSLKHLQQQIIKNATNIPL